MFNRVWLYSALLYGLTYSGGSFGKDSPASDAATSKGLEFASVTKHRATSQLSATTPEEKASELLIMAVRSGDKEVATRLLGSGANVNHQSVVGWTPLFYAISIDREDLVRLLLENGADADVAAATGERPLHIAAQAQHVGIVKLLLDRGVNPNPEAENGLTPLMIALIRDYPEVAQAITNYDSASAAQVANPGNDQVRRIQYILTELGYDPGPIDGLMGPKTRDAISAFQGSSNLDPDGEPSTNLLSQLETRYAEKFDNNTLN